MFITALPFNLDPSICIILPFIIFRPRTPSFALRFLFGCVPTQFRHKLVAWLESHLKLVADGFEAVSFVFLLPHTFVQVNAMGLPAVICFCSGGRCSLWTFRNPSSWSSLVCRVTWLTCPCWGHVRVVCAPPPTIHWWRMRRMRIWCTPSWCPLRPSSHEETTLSWCSRARGRSIFYDPHPVGTC